jgi:hypothetical protein
MLARTSLWSAFAGAVVALVSPARASDVVEVLPLTDKVIVVHWSDGRIVHHTRGKPRSDETVITSPLDTAAASKPGAYTICSKDDPAYGTPRPPTDVGRKTKGTDFTWHCDKWDDKAKRCVNAGPDRIDDHWVYLVLPTPMQHGKVYTLTTGSLAANGTKWSIAFDEAKVRSEAVHVNVVGYVPSAPQKVAYVYHWMGDKGGLDLKSYDGRACHVVDARSGQPLFDAKLALRKRADNSETAQSGDTPNGNYLGADVYQCDFSPFDKPGRYLVVVDGIGSSFAFVIDADVYRAVFRTVARALYHNRSGIELKEPFTKFTRPAPHNPKLTPGFAGKLIYTTVRFTEWGSEGGDAKMLLASSKGPLESAGWYQDAGDWDSYYAHLRVAQELLIAYQLVPKNFKDGDLSIPESGNGVPDILDEAAWLPRFLYRLRHELLTKKYGTGGVGLRIAADAFGPDEKVLPDKSKVGQGSWQDVNRTWAVSGEDPWSTYRYAGVAAQLGSCLKIAGARDPEGIDWAREAAEAYAWAQKNTRSGDEQKKEPSLREARLYAGAALFALTGDKAYEKQLMADGGDISASRVLTDDARYGPIVYALIGLKNSPASPDAGTLDRIRAAIAATADDTSNSTPASRALRWGGNRWMPMLIGQQTTPWILEGAVAYVLVKAKDAVRARHYLASLYTTADYFLGTNSLHQTWITGLGPRHPNHPFHMDAWYNGRGEPHPGIVVYGPWRKDKDVGDGPWDKDWANQGLYPKIDAWPGNERWFDSASCPLTNEFTIHQNIGPAAAFYGILMAPGLQGE